MSAGIQAETEGSFAQDAIMQQTDQQGSTARAESMNGYCPHVSGPVQRCKVSGGQQSMDRAFIEGGATVMPTGCGTGSSAKSTGSTASSTRVAVDTPA